MTALSLELMDVTRDWVSSSMMLCQAFTAADFSCLLVGLSAFSFVFSEWNAAQSCWDQEIDLAIAEYYTFFTFRNSWVDFCCMFWVISTCTMKRRPINFAAFDWIWTESISLYTSEFIRLLLSYHQKTPVTQCHWKPCSSCHHTAPPCFTDDVVCFGSWAVPSLLHTFFQVTTQLKSK